MPLSNELKDDPTTAASTGLPRRSIMLVSTLRIALLGLWFGASMLLARILGQVPLAIYSLSQNAIRLFTDCLADPLDMAVMRQVPLLLRQNREEALRTIRSAFWLRVALGLFSIAIAGMFPWLISRLIFGTSGTPLLALLTAVGILGDLLLRSALGYFQVSERFGPFMLIDAVWQLGRSAGVVVLVATHRLSATTAIALYVAMPYVAYTAAVLLLPKDVRQFQPPHGQRVREILHYGKWVAAAMIIGAVYERLDIFLLEWFRGTQQVGIYAGALTLAMIPEFLSSSVQTVLAPKVAPAHAAGTFPQLQRQYLMYAVPMGAAAALAALILGGPVIRLLLTAKFADSVLPFKLLVMGTLFTLVFTPLPTALLNFAAPKMVLLETSVALAAVAVGGLLLIRPYGAVGAATVMLGARVIVGTMTMLFARRLHSPRISDAASPPHAA